MKKIRAYGANVAAGVVDQSLGTLTVPEGHNYNGVELNLEIPDGTTVKVFIEDEEMVVAQGYYQPDEQRRVINWNVVAGLSYRFYGSNSTGGALRCGVELTYDDVMA